MRPHRINALVIRHLYLFKRSVPRLMDIFYWPVMELLLWGFLSIYLEKQDLGNLNAVTVFLGAVIFWDILNQSQKAVSISFLEDVWERNFLNLFVTPIRLGEFIVSTVVLGIIRIVIITIVMALLAALFYSFNFLSLGFYLIPFMASLLLFGSTLGFLSMAVILRFGTSAQILAWGFIVLIQPFTAVFYPVSALPEAIRPISYLLPSTYVFEGMRTVLSDAPLPWSTLGMSFLLNAVFLTIIIWVFYKMFAKVKERGLLLKMD